MFLPPNGSHKRHNSAARSSGLRFLSPDNWRPTWPLPIGFRNISSTSRQPSRAKETVEIAPLGAIIVPDIFVWLDWRSTARVFPSFLPTNTTIVEVIMALVMIGSLGSLPLPRARLLNFGASAG
jgi:hypothetical protein